MLHNTQEACQKEYLKNGGYSLKNRVLHILSQLQNGEGALFDGTVMLNTVNSAHTVKTFQPHENVSRTVQLKSGCVFSLLLVRR